MMRGFSLLEVLIALTVMTATLLTVVLVLSGIPEVLAHALLRQEALTSANRAFSRELARGSTGFERTASSSSIENGFLITVEERHLGDGSLKQIRSRASWTQTRSVSLEGFLTDYSNAPRYSCSPLLIGNWENPEIQLLTTLNGRFPALSAVTANREYVVAVASTTQESGDASLFLFRVEKGKSQSIAAYDAATSTKIGYVSATLSPSNVFAVSSQSCTGSTACATLEVFSFDGLVRVGSYPLPSARSLAYQDGYLYIGLRVLTSGPEFLIFDVHNPAHPVRVGSMEVGVTVNNITLGNGYAYLATADNSIAGNRAVMIVDTKEPHEGMAPTSSGRPPGAGISHYLALSGSTLFLGRSSPLNSKELYRFDAGDLMRPLAGTDTDGSVAGLVSRGFQLLTLTRASLIRFTVARTESMEKLPGGYALANRKSATSIACGGRNMYLTANEGAEGFLYMLSGS